MDCDPETRVDLHIHSTASDGTLTPWEILTEARNRRLGAISITDHDTLDGNQEALRIGIPDALNFITGVEISCESPPFFPCAGSMHVLGYGIDVRDAAMLEALSSLQTSRKDRNPKILQRLNALGIRITEAELATEAGNGQIGRPHIGAALVRKGVVGSIDEAFDRFLGNGRPAYVDKYRIPCASAIRLIRDAGGVAVLAHPGLLRSTNGALLETVMADFVHMGLCGIEVHYPEHTTADTARFSAIADRHRLLVTGGTDFHGAIKPGLRMGDAGGDFHVPFHLYDALRQACRKQTS